MQKPSDNAQPPKSLTLLGGIFMGKRKSLEKNVSLDKQRAQS